MIDKTFAAQFVDGWIAAWNTHDLPRILSHYTEDFEMFSPIIVEMAGVPSGTLKGRETVGAYWAKALARFPDLRFEAVSTFVGVESITLHFTWERGHSAEVFLFGPHRKVVRAFAHHEA